MRVGDGDDSQWLNVMCFDQDAIAAAERLVKGARVYVEGSLRLDKWTGQDGVEKTGLSCMARLTRLPAIGANKPKREDGAPAKERAPRSNDFYDDPVPF